MKNALRFVLILGLICTGMGTGVAFLYAAFEDRIAQKEARQFEATLGQVLPEGRIDRIAGSPARGTDVYKVTADDGAVQGYAARGEAQGYSSTVRVLVGTRPDAATIRNVAVLEQQETPGLGANVSERRSNYSLWEKAGVAPTEQPERFGNAFLSRFEGRTIAELGEVDAMTAATITSNAVKAGVRQAVRRIREAVTGPTGSGKGG